MSDKKDQIKAAVMKRITAGEIRMKPKWMFAAGSTLVVTGLAAITIATVYILHFVYFAVRSQGLFATRRLDDFVTYFPWWAIAVAILGVIGGIMLLKRYDFSYRKNFPLIITGFIISILLGVYAVDALGLTEAISTRGPMRRFYEEARGRGRGGVKQGFGQGALTVQPAIPEKTALPLPVEAAEALEKALDDEYKAHTTYTAVIEKFGDERPFSQIRQSEEMHIATLRSLFDIYGLKVPENPYAGTITAPDTLTAACQVGVTAEIENAALYQDELIPAASGYPDIISAFERLSAMSSDNHLPAFERCAGR